MSVLEHAQRGRLLLVDDEPNLVVTMAALLAEHVDVETAHSMATAGLALTESQAKFDVVVADYRLPDGSGCDVLRLARSKNENVIGIIWTRRADLAQARCDREHDDVRVLAKASDPQVLITMVRQCLTLAKMRASTKSLRDLHTPAQGIDRQALFEALARERKARSS